MEIPYWISSLIFSFSSSITSRLSPDRTLSFHFLDQPPTNWIDNRSGFTPFTTAQREFTRDVFSYFSSIIDVKFVETAIYSGFNTIVLGNNDQGGSGSAGYMTGAPGDEAWGLFMSNVHSGAGQIADPKNSPTFLYTYLHELGHVLGLKHPFGNTLPILSDAEDNFDLTIMTYGSKSPGIQAPTSILLQPLDIAALQYLYGPSKTAANASRDDTYILNPNGRNFIWDGGGTDKLDASASSKRLVLDLEPFTQGYFGVAATNLISANGQITINGGTLIEQVVATNFDDVLLGNGADNMFWTNGGVDYVDGRAGNDTVVVNAAYAANQLYLEGQQLVIAVNSEFVVRLQDVETVRYTDGDRSVSAMKQATTTVSVPHVTVSNRPSAAITGPVSLNYEFNENVSGLTASDFSVTGGQITSVNGSGKSYVVTVTPAERTTGVLSVQLSAGAVTGATGSVSLASQIQYINFDTKVIALSAGADAVTATNGTIVLRFDDIFTIGAGDIVIQSSSGGQLERLNKNDADRVYQIGSNLYLDLNSQITDGTALTVSIPAGIVLDASGNTVAYTTTVTNRIVETSGTSGADSRNLGPLADIFRGLSGDDRIWGEEGEDFIDGGAGNDRLNGMQGNDTLLGGDGDDILIGGTGDDTIDGGPGTDTAEYRSLISSQVIITKITNGYTVATSAEGIDTLIGVEKIQFSDRILTLDLGPDTTPPALISATPLDGGATGKPTDNIVLSFNEAIQKGSGSIQLRLGSSAGQVVENFDVSTSTRLLISGSTLTVDPSNDLVPNERYFLVLPAGALKDASGNLSNSIDTYDFVANAEGNNAPTFLNGLGQRLSAVIVTPEINEDARDARELSGQDLDGDALTYVISSAALRGTTAFSGNNVIYTPNANFNGTDSFIVTASDGRGGSATMKVNVTIAPVNDAPTFSTSSQSVAATAGTAKTVTLAATDVDGDTLTYTVATPGKGSATISGSTLTYTPTSSASGADSFVVTASDGKGGTATQTINATIAHTTDTAAPTVTTFSPTDGATNVTAISNIIVTFNEAIRVGTGTVEIRSGSATGPVVESFNAATSARLTVSGSALTIDPLSNLAAGTQYFVVLPSGAVRDVAGNAYAGTSTYDFTTAAAPAAAATSFRLIAPDGWSGSIGGNGTIFGSAGVQDIRLLWGSIALDASFNRGGDMVRLAGSANASSASVVGSSAAISTASGVRATVPVGVSGLLMGFDDGARKLVFDVSTGSVRVGTQAVSSVATSISSAAGTDPLPTGMDPAAAARLTLSGGALSPGETAHVTFGGRATIFGSTDTEVVAIASGQRINVTFDPSFNRGGDVIILPNQANTYTATLVGSAVLLSGADQSLSIPVGVSGLTLRFADVDRSLLFNGGAVKIGDQTIGATATALAPSVTLTSISIDNGSTLTTFNAATGAINFTDNATRETNVFITNFTSNDRISVSGASAGDYSFGTDDNGRDLIISFTNTQTNAVNSIVIDDVFVGKSAFIFNYQSASTALGFDFMAFG